MAKNTEKSDGSGRPRYLGIWDVAWLGPSVSKLLFQDSSMETSALS
jgi:hypothetical protein